MWGDMSLFGKVRSLHTDGFQGQVPERTRRYVATLYAPPDAAHGLPELAAEA